jgi:hypothetical protein
VLPVTCHHMARYLRTPHRRTGVIQAEVSLSTHAISRGLMGLSFQGPRGATGFIRFFPSRGAEPSSNLGVCQTSFRYRRRFFLLRDRVVSGQIFSSARSRLPFLESATGGACYLLSPPLGRVFFRYPSILFRPVGPGFLEGTGSVARLSQSASASEPTCAASTGFSEHSGQRTRRPLRTEPRWCGRAKNLTRVFASASVHTHQRSPANHTPVGSRISVNSRPLGRRAR